MVDKKKPHELHLAEHEHHDSVARESLEHVQHVVLPADGAPLTAATALAFCQWLGITTEAQASAALSAPAVSADQLEAMSKVNVIAVSAAFTAELTARVAAGAVRTNAASPADLTAAATRLRSLAADLARLRSGASFLNAAARRDADLLDAVVEDVYPQVTALAAVDPASALEWQPLTSYRQHRHKGGKGAPASSPAPVKPV